jgi:transcription-repair coupling factor (superfamily II helicase)
VLTYVGAYDEGLSLGAVRRELLREGQVFWVHNRVATIDRHAAWLQEQLPDARVVTAHGQMDEALLEQQMMRFWNREADVLVSTVIIESGLDVPNANTLIVDRADALGLSQMYQLRGRVGRSTDRAFAYFFFAPQREMTDEARERLATISANQALGSGFKIALRDLEIRGAGNLLGAEQSGHIAAVGFDLYCQLVTEAVGELKGETPPAPVEVTIDVPVDAYLPTEYLSRDDVRMEAYRRLAAVTTPADVDDIRDEWQDRYGPPPGPAAALLDVARLRAECVRTGMRSLSVQRGVARITGLELRESQKIRLRRLVPGAVAKADGEVAIPVSGSGAALCAALVDLLGELVPADEAAPVTSAAP